MERVRCEECQRILYTTKEIVQSICDACQSDDFVEKIGKLLRDTYGDNTFVIEDWEDGIMYFKDDNNKEIRINEFTMEITEV